MRNRDEKVINDFGQEWTKFSYEHLDQNLLYENFQQYFGIFPLEKLTKNSVGFDMGCGTGRWAQFIAAKVKTLNCIEPSNAILVSKRNLRKYDNVKFYNETSDKCTLPDASQDFGYCLGVLHHIPNTEDALKDCTRLLKPGAPFLLYIYYNFDNKPTWYKMVWQCSNIIRKIISVSPVPIKNFFCSLIAYIVYFPLAKLAYLVEKLGLYVENIPLADYRHKSFYQCKNDALDRFGTRLEQRFSKEEITKMLINAGCHNIVFSNNAPYWCCVAYKK